MSATRARPLGPDDVAAMFKTHRHWFTRVAASRLKEQHHLAEDIVQEAVVRVLDVVQSGAFRETKPAGLRRFLFVVIRNVTREALVSEGITKPHHVKTWKARAVDESTLEPIFVTLDAYEESEDRATLLDALRLLTPQERAAHLRVDYRGDSYDEAAEDMETTRNNVALLVYRARNKIAFYIAHGRLPKDAERFGVRKALVKQATRPKRRPAPISAEHATQLAHARTALAVKRRQVAHA